jgi:hypothetical protein
LIFKKLYFDETKTNHHLDNVLKNLFLQLKWVWEMITALCADRITFDVLGDFHVHEMVIAASRLACKGHKGLVWKANYFVE